MNPASTQGEPTALAKSVAGNRLRWLSTLSVVASLGIWSLVVQTGLVSERVISPPWEVAAAIFKMATKGFAGVTLQVHLLASLGRFAAGYCLAVFIGVPFGLLMGWCSPFRYVVTPFFEAFRFIAPLAWIPFAALWFGTGIGGPTLIVFSGAFSACVINSYWGTRLIDPLLIEASRTLGASYPKLVVHVLFPGALPSIVAGMRISAALGWQALVGAELIAASSGMGYVIVQGQSAFATPVVLAGMVAIGLVGLSMDSLLRFAEAKVSKRWMRSEG